MNTQHTYHTTDFYMDLTVESSTIYSRGVRALAGGKHGQNREGRRNKRMR
jgi:hypothetical protein